MTYHVVCHDCPFESIEDDEADAKEKTAMHGFDTEPNTHDVEYAEVDDD